MDELDRRLAVYDDRFNEFESALTSMADQILSLESILNDIASAVLPEDEQLEQPEEK